MAHGANSVRSDKSPSVRCIIKDWMTLSMFQRSTTVSLQKLEIKKTIYRATLHGAADW